MGGLTLSTTTDSVAGMDSFHPPVLSSNSHQETTSPSNNNNPLYPSTSCAASMMTTTTTANNPPPYLMGYAGSAPNNNTEYNNNSGAGGGVPPIYLQERQGGTFCGCCCDFRRATIIVNSVIMGLSAFSLFSLFNRPDSSTKEILQDTMEDITDDIVLEELAQVVDESLLAGSILGGVLLLLTAIPLYGAYMFNVRMVGFGVVLLGASLITEIVLGYIYVQQADDVVKPTDLYEFNQPIVIYTGTALLQVFFMYPHVGLIMEMRAGIMSFETYPREAYSCCCGSLRPPTVSSQQQQQQQQVQLMTMPSSNTTTTTTMNGQPPPTAAVPPTYTA